MQQTLFNTICICSWRCKTSVERNLILLQVISNASGYISYRGGRYISSPRLRPQFSDFLKTVAWILSKLLNLPLARSKIHQGAEIQPKRVLYGGRGEKIDESALLRGKASNSNYQSEFPIAACVIDLSHWTKIVSYSYTWPAPTRGW